MIEIIKIVIKSISGYGPVNKVYEDRITLTHLSICYLRRISPSFSGTGAATVSSLSRFELPPGTISASGSTVRSVSNVRFVPSLVQMIVPCKSVL